MAENINLEILKIIKEVSKQNIASFELEYEGIKIKLTNSNKDNNEIEKVSNKHELPTASQEQLDEIEVQENKTIAKRIEERDEELLNEIDYLDPALAGQLRRANLVKVGLNGAYEYVEEERLDA